jgi:hypothetical protein
MSAAGEAGSISQDKYLSPACYDICILLHHATQTEVVYSDLTMAAGRLGETLLRRSVSLLLQQALSLQVVVRLPVVPAASVSIE